MVFALDIKEEIDLQTLVSLARKNQIFGRGSISAIPSGNSRNVKRVVFG
jgi:hypothetical protein